MHEVGATFFRCSLIMVVAVVAERLVIVGYRLSWWEGVCKRFSSEVIF